MPEVARRGWIALVVGVALGGLVGCGHDTEAYCDAVSGTDSLEIVNGSDPSEVQEQLDTIVELAPEEIAPLWEDFAAGYANLVTSATEMDQVEQLSSELEETGEEIERDYQTRCGDERALWNGPAGRQHNPTAYG